MFIGDKNFSNQEIKSCNQAQMEKQVQLDTKFIKHAAAYRMDYCSGNSTNLITKGMFNSDSAQKYILNIMILILPANYFFRPV